MRKIFIYPVAIIALLALYQAPSSAQQENTGFFDKFTFGIEGSYISSVFVYRHFNFISSYGYRIDHKYSDTGYRNNGEFLIHFGLRKFLIKTKEYFTDISGVANDFADTVKDLLDDGKVNGSVGNASDATETAPAQPTVFVTGQPIPADPNQKQ